MQHNGNIDNNKSTTAIDAGEAPKLAQHTKWRRGSWAKSKSERRAQKTRK